MATETKATCATCRWWSGGFSNVGQCRRRSPVLLGNETIAPQQAWPGTWNTDWCGEHQPHEDTESAEASTAS